MRSFKTYSFIILLVITPVLLGLLLPGFWYPPFYGDLTRIGNLSEQDYGWQVTQKYYPELLFKRDVEKYTSYSDVVVIGDSFSMPTRVTKPHEQGKYIYWTNEFANKTGLSITAIHVDALSIDELVASESFRLHPPKIVIYQSAERGVERRLKNTLKQPCKNLYSPKVDAVLIKNMNILSSDDKLLKKNYWLDYETNVYVVRHKIKKLFKNATTDKVKLIPLKNVAPFSSKEKMKLLIVKDDYLKEKLTHNELNEIHCNLIDIQNKIQENGYTLFFTMISPDKLTMYAPLAKDTSIVKKSILEQVELNKNINWIKVGTVLGEAIDRGQLDIYRPNDTHWGSTGGELVSDEVISQLQSRGILYNSY